MTVTSQLGGACPGPGEPGHFLQLLPEAAGQSGRRRMVRQVDPLVRVGFQVEELVGVGR